MRPQVNKIRLTILIALLFSALCAGVFRTPPILFMAALLTGAPVVGLLLGHLSSRGLRMMRTLPESGMAGDVITGEITLSNNNRWPLFLVHTFCGGALRAGGAVKPSRTTSDKPGTAAWAIAPVGGDEQVVPILHGLTRASWKQQWHLRRRGVYQLEPGQAGVLDPLGLNNRLPVVTGAHSVVVLPRPVRIEQIGFMGSDGPEQQTPRYSTIVADAMDLHGVRPWQPGEAIRRAHWKHTARTGQLHVIEWEETPAADLAILLDVHADAFAGNDDDNTLETAIVATASIAYFLLENGCRFQLFYYMSGEEKGKDNKTGVTEASPPRLKSLLAHSVDSCDAVLRALAEIEPVSHPAADAAHLADAALPQLARGLGGLLVASSRAPLDKAMSRSMPGRFGGFRALVVDAESFEMPVVDQPKKTSEAAPTLFTAARRGRRPGRHGAFVLRRGEPIGAALEGYC